MKGLASFQEWVRGKFASAPPEPQPPPHQHTPPADDPDGLFFQLPAKERPDVYASLGSTTPTAPYLERKRIDREAFEKRWGLRLD
jgi:hypothetical protein